MITRQQRITAEFWRKIHSDADWRGLEESTEESPPSELYPNELLSRLGVRAPSIKAAQIRKAWNRDWQALASLGAKAFAELAAQRDNSSGCRDIETRLASRIQVELRGCGVGPKISRLMMIWKPHFGMGSVYRHVIPLDSRWQAALVKSGAALPSGVLLQETGYRAVEDEVCRAAYEIGIPPFIADGAVFGWIDD